MSNATTVYRKPPPRSTADGFTPLHEITDDLLGEIEAVVRQHGRLRGPVRRRQRRGSRAIDRIVAIRDAFEDLKR